MNKSKHKNQKLALAAPTLPVKLDLACGQRPREGFEGVDIWPKAQHVVNLMKFPWPWKDNTVDELHSSHFIEHLPLRDLTADDLNERANGTAEQYLGQDFLFAFFDECYRILKPDGVLTVICPTARSNRGFQDPTHRRFIVAETFAYLWRQWRVDNLLDHYRVKCNFAGTVNHTQLSELNVMNPESAARRMNESWNVIFDWHAVMKAIK